MLNVAVIPIIVVAFFLGYSALRDLRTREVPNWIPLTLTVFGILFHFSLSYLQKDWFILGTSLLVGFSTFILAYLLWRLGVWAGGDVKLFAAIGFALPINPAPISVILSIPLFSSTNWPIFPLTLFIFSIFMGLPVALIKLLQAFFSNSTLRSKMKKDLIRLLQFFILLSAASTSLYVLLSAFLLPSLVALPLLLILFLLPQKVKIVLTVLLVLFSWINYPLGSWFESFILLLLVTLLIGLLLESQSWAKEFVFTKKVAIKDLKEGDISAQTLIEENGKITEWTPPTLKAIFNNPKNLSLLPPSTARISASRAGGLEQEDLTWLQTIYARQTKQKFLKIKESLAFVPLVWLSFVCLLIIGDALWLLLFP